MARTRTIICSLALIAMATAGLVARETGEPPEVIRVTVDVAEDFSKFTPTLVSPGDRQPTRGSFFLTEGRVFPKGTIKGDGSTFDPNSAGAIGTWLCRGTHLADASAIADGSADVWVATTQNYLFPDDRLSVATEGREGSAPSVRTVVGGTGPLRDYVGEQHQQLLGFNTTGGVNLRVTFVLTRVRR